MTFTRPDWAEVSRGRLLHNYRWLRELAGLRDSPQRAGSPGTPSDELVAVVKANAYGHGRAGCASVLAGEGAGWFGVTSVEEAVSLRQVCPGARILAMSGLWHGEAEAVLARGITPAVWEPLHLELLVEAAQRRGSGAGTVPVHLEIDTGMSRQGVPPGELERRLEAFGAGSPLRLEAVMTHFHSAEDREATQAQMRVFAAAVEGIVGRGLRPEFLSAGSSASVLQQDTEDVTNLARRIGARRMVRVGLGLYGYAPSPARQGGAGLLPVLAWKSRVTSLREIEAGAVAGYDATFRAERRTRLALVPVGYADGLSRRLSNCGCMLVRGQRAAIAGRISMDQTMLDVTEIPGVAIGDEVVLIGEQGGESISAADLAQQTGTISYEVLCAIGARVPRVMVD